LRDSECFDILTGQAVGGFWLNPRKGDAHMTMFEVLYLLLTAVLVILAWLDYMRNKK
jgi:hypothetical protein